MHEKLVAIRAFWDAHGYPRIQIRIGINTSTVLADNIGSKARMKYGVLGDGVNLAARLEEPNKRYGTQILITDEGANEPLVRDFLAVRPTDCVSVKGRSAPVVVYEAVARSADATKTTKTICRTQAEPMRAFLSRRFKDSIELMEEIQALEETDRPDPAVSMLKVRAEKFVLDPPPDDCRGAEVLSRKQFLEAKLYAAM